MKKSWKNRSAVSPVIATILMVAITVVLAAVLYVMVMGMGGSGSNTPTANINKNASNQYVVSISQPTAFANMKFAVSGDGSGTGTSCTFSAAPYTATYTQSTGNVVTVTFHDVGDDKKVTAQDYFTVATTGTVTDHVTLALLYVNGDTVTSLATVAL